MSQTPQPLRTRDLTIAHPTELREAEHSACAHAVALALSSHSRLLSLHVNDAESSREHIPRAVDLLVRWGKLPKGASEGDETTLGMRHERTCESCCDDPVDTLLSALKRAEPDLIVAATRAREGAQRYLFGSVIEALTRHMAAPALLLPPASRPLVSEQTGTLHLLRILVPVGDAESAEVAAAHAAWFADVAGAGELEVELLHVEDGSPMPTFALPKRLQTRFSVHSATGSLEDAIARRAVEGHADLIVMSTRGHDSLRDMLKGSHTERVLHRAPCPVLSVPLREESAQPVRS